MSDQMDLLVEQVKMLAGDIAFSTSTLKRLTEQSVNDPEGSKTQVICRVSNCGALTFKRMGRCGEGLNYLFKLNVYLLLYQKSYGSFNYLNLVGIRILLVIAQKKRSSVMFFPTS